MSVVTYQKNTEELFASLDLTEFLPLGMIRINPLSASLHYSHAIFEGMSLLRVDGGIRLFHPWLNLERMRRNAEAVGIEMRDFGDQQIIANIFALAAMNGFHKCNNVNNRMRKAGKEVSRFYVRPLLYVDSDGIGLGAHMIPRFLLTVTPMGQYLRNSGKNGIDTMLFPQARNLPLPGVKTASNYQIGIISRKKMEQFNKMNGMGCAETVFLNEKGYLVEGSGENIVLLRDKTLISPPPSEGAIPGITLRMITTIAIQMGLDFKFGTFRPRDLKETDSLFLTGNAAGVVPVSSLVEVDKCYSLKRRRNFTSCENTDLRKLMAEYEKMEIGQGAYDKFHTKIDDWLSVNEQDRLYSYAAGFSEEMDKAGKPGMLQGCTPRPQVCGLHTDVEGGQLIKKLGIASFYPGGHDFHLS